MKKLICYGAGAGFSDFCLQLKPEMAKIIGVIDKKASKENIKYPYVALDQLENMDYDYVIICSRKYRNEMAENLRIYGIPERKIALSFSCIGVGAPYIREDLMQKMAGVKCFVGSYACAVLIGRMMIVYIEGPLNSCNAKAFRAEIISFLLNTGVRHIVVDAEQLSDITPQGLRCFLELNSEYPDMTIVNLSHELYEMFLRSGMDSRIEVVEKFERRWLRQVSVEGYPYIAEGGDAKVYEFGDDAVLKLFYKSKGWDYARHVFVRGRRSFAAGVPTAIPIEMVRCKDLIGILYERLGIGANVSSLVLKTPALLEELVGKMADLLKNLHRMRAPSGCVSSSVFWEENIYRKCSSVLSPQEWNLVQKAIDSVPDRRTSLHGDFHWSNVLEANGELYFIDISGYGAGHPILDVSSAYGATVGYCTGMSKRNGDILQQSWQVFRDRYFGINNPDELMFIDEMMKFYRWLHYLSSYGTAVLEDARKEWFPTIEENIVRFRGKLEKWELS